MMIPRAQTILEDKGRDAQRVQPLGDLLPFMVAREHRIATTRTDDDRRALGQVRLRLPDGETRHIFVRVCPLAPGTPWGQRGMVWWGCAKSWAWQTVPGPVTLAKTPSSTQPLPDLDNRIAGSS